MNKRGGRTIAKRIAGLALRRRTLVERRVLGLLRGSGLVGSPLAVDKRRQEIEPPALPRSQNLYFAELRRKARHAGLAIQPPETPYLTEDELSMLGWLARAQRVDGLNAAILDDPLFNAQIARCAGALDMAGLRLPPQAPRQVPVG